MRIFNLFESKKPDSIIVGSSRRNNKDELHILEQIQHRDKKIPLILFTMHSSEARIIDSFRAGINDDPRKNI